jgi:hypothetical protein
LRGFVGSAFVGSGRAAAHTASKGGKGTQRYR